MRLVALLFEHGVLCVCELEEVLGVTQYTVSRRLRILRRTGLVEDRRHEVRLHYALRGDLNRTVKDLFGAAFGLIGEEPRVEADRATAPVAAGRSAGMGSSWEGKEVALEVRVERPDRKSRDAPLRQSMELNARR